jgi:SET domain-containing protein
MQKLPKKFTLGDFNLRVGRSRTGKGLFTEEKIPKGACIIEYIGRPVVGDEQFTHRGKYLFETSKTTMIDGSIKENTAKYINHSCKPNCEIDITHKRVFVFALRNIKAGEELTYDYDTEYFDTYIKPRGCLCQKCSPVKV